MAYSLIQNSFLAGELSPDISARVNIEAYAAGAAEIFNCFVDYRGGVLNRAGTQWVFIVQCGNEGYSTTDEDMNPRLVPFIYEEEQAIMLVFAGGGLYFMSDGAPLLGESIAIDTITNADPGVVTLDSDYTDESSPIVYISGVGGMTELNGRYFKTNAVGAPGNYNLRDIYNGDYLDTSSFGVYTSGGTAQAVYRILPSDLNMGTSVFWALKFIQIRDTMIIVSPFEPPKLLTRTTPTDWTITDITFESSTVAPTNVSLDANFTGSGTTYAYVVTATDRDTGVESLPTSQETISKDYWPNARDSVKIEWDEITGAAFYSIYRASVVQGRLVHTGSLKGLIGQTRGDSFNDDQIAPNYSITPPKERNPFDTTDHYPSCVTVIQQRVAYAGTINRPYKAWLTPVGDFTSLNSSQPPRDTDSLTFELASTRADPIKNLLAMTGGLLAFTAEAVYHIYGGADGSPLTPNNINSDPVSHFGAGDVIPIAVGFHVLYTQNDNSIIRDLQYNFFATSYESTDITILASHFFKDMRIVKWAYSNRPWKVVWAVRNDGKLLSLTYVPEQNVFAFALHETNGFVLDIATIPEHGEDVPYLIICRSYKDSVGAPFNPAFDEHVATIERMRSRVISEIEDAWFLDNALNSTLTAGTGVIHIEILTETTATIEDIEGANSFTGSVVDRVIRAAGGMLKITAKTNNNLVTVEILRPMTQVNDPGFPIIVGEDNWSMVAEFSTFSGLWHLEDKEVWALADGGVQGPFTVVDGSITLDSPASYVVIGLKYESRLKTLRPEMTLQNNGSIQGKRKNISSVMMRMTQTRGIEIGPNFEEMDTWNPRVIQPLGQPPPLVTGDEHCIIAGTWNEEGQVCLRQAHPLPMQVLGLVPEIEIGDT